MTRNPPSLSRRAFLAGGLAATGIGRTAGLSALARSSAQSPVAFPAGFHWGAATAAHQVEGGNVNSDIWVLEQMTPSMYPEPSGDACDFYHRYRDDIALARSLGLNAFRFSIEWARVEPTQGAFSNAELDHYRRITATCREQGLTPMVTLWHFTSPRWFAALGGWEHAGAGDLFTRYCERTARHLGDLVGAAATFNEPNIPILLEWLFKAMPQNPFAGAPGMMQAAAKSIGAEKFSFFMLGDSKITQANMLPAHHRAVAAIKGTGATYPVGVTLAMADEQAAGPDSRRDEKREALYGPWLDAARKDDFIGVQTYTRARVGRDGDLPPEPGAELTQMGYEFYPEALEQTIRYAASRAKVPVYVTENGVGTEDDTRRVEYITRALRGVSRCLADGIDVRGYYHWSFLDNFEWNFGYRPKFGLVAVNRQTFERTVKPSARLLGEIARRNGL